jgi:hypothetical protein
MMASNPKIRAAESIPLRGSDYPAGRLSERNPSSRESHNFMPPNALLKRRRGFPSRIAALSEQPPNSANPSRFSELLWLTRPLQHGGHPND